MSPLEIPAYDDRLILNYPKEETVLHKLVVKLAKWVFRLFMFMNVTGLENLPQNGAAIVVANHLVLYDVIPLQLALPRMVFYMGKAELFQNGIVHFIFRNMGGFPVYRGKRDAWAIDHAKKLLDSGQIVALFPEGTRSQGKGLALARPGAAKLAIEVGCPLVVVSINGVQNLFREFPRRTLIQVVVAPPIIPKDGDSPLSLTDAIMFTMAKNLPQELRGVYSESPEGFR